MASLSLCVGCGQDISNANGRRLLYTDACRHISVIWAPFFDEQLNQRGLLPQASTFLDSRLQSGNSSLGRMCRRCFTVFERYGKMLSSIMETVAKAIDQLMEANIVTSDEPENESADTFLHHLYLKDWHCQLILHLLMLWYVCIMYYYLYIQCISLRPTFTINSHSHIY